MPSMRLFPSVSATLPLVAAVIVCFLVAGCPNQPAASDTNIPLPDTGGGVATEKPLSNDCAQCHANLVARYTTGPHKSFATECLVCHENGREHMADPIAQKAAVHFSLELCSSCHAQQYSSYLHDDESKAGHFGGSIATSKYDEWPRYRYLMGGHGFTIQYNEERAHAYVLKDHIETRRRQTTTCLQCKSTPVAYYWNEEPRGQLLFHKQRPWAEAVEQLRTDWPETIDYGVGCNHCHDPHDGNFRLIRKGVVQAILERGTDPYSTIHNRIPTSREDLSGMLNERGPDGKRTPEALRLAGILTCAQCHIEYVCGQGADRTTTGEIRDDVPWRKLADLEAYYRGKFNLQQDWRHSITGELGIKPQHPEVEEYWGSVHHRLGMSCADCHMAKTRTADGRAYTSHWLTSPLKNNTQSCRDCHENVQAELFAVQDAFYAQARAVEELLFEVLQRIEAANASGAIPVDRLTRAKELYMRALLWWEWTAVSENSMGAHYPDQARQQLQYAHDEASEALQLLQ